VVPLLLRQIGVDVGHGEVAANDLQTERRGERDEEAQRHVHNGRRVRALVVDALQHLIAARDHARLLLAGAFHDAWSQAVDDRLGLLRSKAVQQHFFGTLVLIEQTVDLQAIGQRPHVADLGIFHVLEVEPRWRDERRVGLVDLGLHKLDHV
jgi:hypothetical protein